MTESGHQTSVEPSDEPVGKADHPPAVPATGQSNVAIILGGLMIIVSFFLPWIYLGPSSASGFQIAFEKTMAQSLISRFGVYAAEPTQITRPLALVPLFALAALMLHLTTGKRVPARIVSRMLIFATGLVVAMAFGYVGAMVVEVRPAPAFWTTFGGGMFIALGSIFDVVRGN
jgi:hypothetical protein